MKKDMTIDEFIEIVYPKIKQEVRKMKEPIKGSELMLTGVKDVDGEKIIPERTYMMDVPVVIHHDHRRKLRLAWLRGGKIGVSNYLSKWLDSKVHKKVMSVL